jgi:hypothetical protein
MERRSMNVAVMKDGLKDQKDVLVSEFPYQRFLNGDGDNQWSKWTSFFAAQHGNIFALSISKHENL